MNPRRWSKFWWADYENDDTLRGCSLAAQGLWMRILCMMHKAERVGFLLINGEPPTVKKLALLVSAPQGEVARCLEELKKSGVCRVDPNGFLYSKRMDADHRAYLDGVANGAAGGNPQLRKTNPKKVNGGGGGEGLTPPAPPEAEARIKKEEAEKIPPLRPPQGARGTRLPDGWHPSATGQDFSHDLGLDGPAVLARFRDFWRAKAGANASKVDWEATWRNWCRREAEQAPKAQPFRNGFLENIRQDRAGRTEPEPENAVLQFLRLPNVH